MYGKTFGKHTYESSTGDYVKGIDLPAEKKFQSTLQKEFVDQKTVDFEPAAKIVGINRQDDTYQRPIDAHTQSKFWGTEDRDNIASEANMQKNTKVFYQCDSNDGKTYARNKQQSEDDALKSFYNLKDQKQEHLNPIPGYSGVSRRVGADNIFGLSLIHI